MNTEGLDKKIIRISLVFFIIFSLVGPIAVSEKNKEMNILEPLETLEYEPQSHDFGNMEEGEINSTIFEIWRGGGCCELTYQLLWDCDWVDVFPVSGISNGEHDPITVTVDTTGLDIELHTCDITIESSAGNAIFPVTVNVIRSGDPTLAYYPQSYHFGYIPEGSTESTTFDIWNTGTGTLNYDLTWDENWVEVFPTSGSSLGEHDTITVDIDTTGFETGSTHTSQISIHSNGGDKIFTVLVNIGENPEVTIGNISGGFFTINAVIQNTGTCDIVGLDWKISLNGGFIPIGQESSGKVAFIQKGDEVTVTSDMIIGLGTTVVTVEAGIPENVLDVKTIDAKVLLFFISIT